MNFAVNLVHAFGAIIVSIGMGLLLDEEDFSVPALAFGLFLLAYVV